ncbi:MAG: hypothetical protein KBG15_16740 [Kofleriaceae bacterium]|nr:hypothetical protein [Kofleriaceae bacterium]
MRKLTHLGLGLLGCSMVSCGFTASPDNSPSDGRDSTDSPPQDAGLDAPLLDAPDAPLGAFVVDHLGVVAPLLLQGSVIINSVTNVSSLALVPAVQPLGGSPISVLYFDTLVVNARFNIDGNKPVLLVGNYITVNGGGGINAGANGIVAFAGGSNFTARGLGGGGTGTSAPDGSGADSGGGGGGFGTVGAAGGTADAGAAAAGAAGMANGTAQMATLFGGSAGGDSACDNNPARGGAGGGAVQLTARVRIVLNGVITAHGGGGSAGQLCATANTYDSAAGGGAGGVVFIQTPVFTMNGGSGLFANGGGGGAAAQKASPFFGTAGENGFASTTAAAGGVAANAQVDRNGGAGGVQGSAPGTGGNGNNSGGGGGAVGRIVIHGPLPAGTFSPTPVAYN